MVKQQARQDERPAATGLPREMSISSNPHFNFTCLELGEQVTVLREYDPREVLAERDAAMGGERG